MTSINGLGAAGSAYQAYLQNLQELTGISQDDLKEALGALAGTGDLSSLFGESDVPDLPLAKCALSLETRVRAVSAESRKNGPTPAIDSLDANAGRQEIGGEQRLSEIQKQLEAQDKQSIWDKFVKAFKIIGAIFGAIASVATIALGAATGNPLLIAGGVMSAVMTIDSIVSTASDGKYSLATGFTELGKAMGMSDSTAQWFGFGLNLAVMLAGTVVGFAGAGVASSAKIAESASSAVLMTARASTVANIGEGVSGIGTSITEAGSAVAQKAAADAQANVVDIDAILEKLRASQESNEKFVELSLQTLQALMGAVKEIVSECADTTTTILAGSPSMA